MSKSRALIAGLIVGITLTGGACSGTQSREKVINEKGISVVNIGSLKKNPSLYLGKMITIKGEYRGWKAEGSPLITRSDWGVRDETGTIYVTGRLPNLDPHQDIGRKITVTGTLHLKSDIPYIKVVRIEIGKRE
ncbi:hypothetical protein KAT51_08335 [bacterium]|nr:hypothetical protein [bacterium]